MKNRTANFKVKLKTNTNELVKLQEKKILKLNNVIDSQGKVIVDLSNMVAEKESELKTLSTYKYRMDALKENKAFIIFNKIFKLL